MNIGLFGGSFNPPHVGHLWLADQFRVKGNLDLIWILVSPDPPHKEPSKLVSYEHRLEMARLTFLNSFGVELNVIEEELPKPNYTYQTVEALKSKYPTSTFWLCIGEDSLHDLTTWMEPNRLVRNINLLVARRGAFTQTSDPFPDEWSNKVSYIDIVPKSTSSTTIRERVASGQSIEEMVTPEVMKYIVNHKLYRF
jgi:nicotinate-nucleotide adenylyltransferase